MHHLLPRHRPDLDYGEITPPKGRLQSLPFFFFALDKVGVYMIQLELVEDLVP